MTWQEPERGPVGPGADMESGRMVTAGAPQEAQTPHRKPAGSCFGYEVRSRLEFRFLREGGGEPLLVEQRDLQTKPVDEPLMEWTQIGGQPFAARLHGDGRSYSLWIEETGWYHIDPVVPAVTVPSQTAPIRREQRLWGIPAALCFLERGDLPIHASAVDIEGSALLLAAPGHFGKTTLAAAFLGAGHRVLAEDISCGRASPVPVVFPGPATLRIRRDAYPRLEFPGTHVVAEDAYRVHLAIDDGLRGSGLPVPIAGVVFLRQSQGNECRLERVQPAACLPDIWTLIFKMPIQAQLARCFQAAADLASQVPVWNLYRPLRFDTLPEVVDRIVSTCLSAA
jgi:hypothetical protein